MKVFPSSSGILLWTAVLLLIPALASAQTTKKTYDPPPARPSPPPVRSSPPPERPSPPPERPSYTPPPAPRPYTPPAPPPERPSYTPPAPAPRSYTPPPTNGAGNGERPSNPSPNAPPRSYTPGFPSGNATARPPSPSGGTTYTPHVYTPGSPNAGGAGAAHSSGGATVYTPHASTAGTTYTPHTTGTGSATAGRDASGTEGVRSANGVTTYTPHASTGSSATPEATRSGGGASYVPRSPSTSIATSAGTHTVYSLPAASAAGKIATGASTLTTAGSQSVLHQVNSARAGLTGVNKKSIPEGQVAVHPDGKLTVTATNGRQFDLRPNGTLASFHKLGENATFRGNGHLTSLHTPAIDINRGPHGQRIVVTPRPDHSLLVSTGRNSGYLQRIVVHNRNTYIQRTYVSGNLRVSRVYSTYTYHGLLLDHYVPSYFYAPALYGWAYYPWDTPAAYAWGWLGAPWYGYYGSYFSPWNSYLSGANWLTDYYLSQTLATGYQQQDPVTSGDQYADDSIPQDGSDDAYTQADTPITPEVKQAIAEEVQQQLAYENAAAVQPDAPQTATLTDLPQVLTPNHVFVVDQPRNAITADSQACGLSAGNVLRMVAAPADGSPTADLTVVSSRRGDCPAGVQITVSLQDLEEMQNNFRA